MPNTQNIISLIIAQAPVYASAVSAICAAYAAYKSYSVSKDSFNLQMKFIQNQDLIFKINLTIEELESLSIIVARNPLELPDSEIGNVEISIQQIKNSLGVLNVGSFNKTSIPSIDKFSSLEKLYRAYSENPMFIENSINQLKKYRNLILL